jgi:hypothetical protein
MSLYVVVVALLATCIHAGFLLGLFFDPEDGGNISPKRQLTFNRLHSVISQKTVLFMLLFLLLHKLKTYPYFTLHYFLMYSNCFPSCSKKKVPAKKSK